MAFTITNKTDTLSGTTGNDEFDLTTVSDLSSKDVIKGDLGTDKIVVTGAATPLTDVQFTGVSSVEQLVIDGVVGHVTLGAKATAAGINLVDGSNASDTLQVDASAYANAAGITVIGFSGISDIKGSKFGDTFKFKDTDLSAFSKVAGGTGTDTLAIAGSGNTVSDGSLINFSSIEQVTLTGSVAGIALGANAAKAGINLVDGSAVSDTLTVDASAFTGASGIQIIGGGAQDTLTGSQFDDTFTYNKAADLNQFDTVDGGAGHNKLVIGNSGNGFATANIADAQFAGVSNIQDLVLRDGQMFAVLGANAAAAGITDVFGANISDTLSVKAGGFTGDAGLRFHSVDNVFNEFVGSAQDDTIFFTQAWLQDIVSNNSIDGGGQNNRTWHGDILQVDGDGKTPLTVNDADLQDTLRIETLQMVGKLAVTANLGGESEQGGIGIVEAGTVSGLVTVDASARTTGIEIYAGSAANKLTGTIDNDTFFFTSKGLSGDTVDGRGVGDADLIAITDKAAVVDAAFGKVSNVEGLSIGTDPNGAPITDYSGAKVTLGALSVKAGIVEVDNNTDYALTVDASARGTTGTAFVGNIGDDIFLASTGGADSFAAGGGNDSFRIKLAALDNADFFAGGAGTDEIRILDSQDAKNAVNTSVVDADLAGMFSVERLVFDGTGKQNVILAGSADQAGLQVVDAGKVAGGLTLDAGAMNNDLSVIAGSGKDSITLGSGDDDVFIAQSKLTKDDQIEGGAGANVLHFTEAAKLTDAVFVPLTGKVTNFIELDLDSAAAKQTAVLGNSFFDFAAAASLTEIHAGSDSAAASFTFDFSGHSKGYAFNVFGSFGGDTFVGGGKGDSFFGGDGDDLFKYSSANFVQHALIDGSGDNDTILITDAGDNVNGLKLTDANFAGVAAVEKLQFGASKTGFYDLTTGKNFNGSGITTIDASLAGVDATINAAAATKDLTIFASAKNNAIFGGSGNDTIAFDAKTLNSTDGVDAGAGFDTLKLTTAGVLKSDAFADIHHVEILQLSDAGNSVTLDSLLGSSGGVSAVIGAHSFRGFNFLVQGGKGSDTVDLHLLSNGGVGVFAGGGTDTLIGSTFHDVFMFANAGDLTAADKIDGGANDDEVVSVAGIYSSDQFKGFKSIEIFTVFDGDFAKGSTIAVKNDFMQTLTADASGRRSFTIQIDDQMTGDNTVDASGVTGTLNGVVVSVSVGDDTLTGGAGNDVFKFVDDSNGNFNLNGGDKVAGGGGFDAIDLNNEESSNPASLNDSDLEGVTGVEALVLHSGSGFDVEVTLGANAARAGITEVDARDLGPATNLTLDASNYGFTAPNGITLVLGAGNDDITLSGNDDIVRLTNNNSDLDATDDVKFGGGTDTIQFQGADDITDTPFTFAHDVEVAALMGAASKITLGKFADAAGLQQINAAQAQQAVTIDASAMSHGLAIYGSSFADTIKGTKSDDVIVGGSGKDTMTGGGGVDTYGFFSSDDSRLGANGDLSHVDLITDFGSDDQIAVNPLQTNQNIVRLGDGALVITDTADFFKLGGIVAQFDGKTGLTTVYINNDLNNGTGFEIAKDIVFQIQGNHVADIDLPGSFVAFDHPGALHPVLTENTPEPIPAGNYGEGDLPGGTNVDALVLTSTKGDYTVALGANSEADGFRFVDGSKVTGKLTIDASGRSDPVYIASGTGVNNLTGTAGDDVFYFTNAGLSATDKVNGGLDGKLLFTGSDRDTLFITDKSTLTDAAFAGVKNVEILEFGPSPLPGAAQVDVTGQKVVLGANSEKALIGTVINDYDTGLTVDASGRGFLVNFTGGGGNDVLIGSTEKGLSGVFSNDIFNGGAGDDSFHTKLFNFGIQSLDTFNGGTGIDEVRVLDSYDGKTTGQLITDFNFQSFTSVERLVFDGTGKQNVTLGAHADASGLSIIDASKVAGGLFLDATADTRSLSVTLGTGADDITLSGAADQNDVFMVSKNLTAADHIDAGFTQSGSNLHFTDKVNLADKAFAGLNVQNVAHFDLDNSASGQSVVIGANFSGFIDAAGIFQIVATTTSKAASFTFDLTGYTGTNLNTNGTVPSSDGIIGSAGSDIFLEGAKGVSIAGSLDGTGAGDSFRFASANFDGAHPIHGDSGAGDEIVILDTGTKIVDDDFKNITGVETLRLAASKSGEYHIQLDSKTSSHADDAGIVKVDGSLAGVLVDIDATKSSKDLTLIGGSKANFLSAGSGDDTIIVDAKTFGADDGIDGGASTNGDVLKFSTGGIISTAAFAANQVGGIEILQFSDAGNSLVATGAVVAQSDGNAVVSLPDGSLPTFDFAILGGKGSDTVDLSGIAAGFDIAVVGNGGADKFTGSGGDDTFIFPLAGDLTSADVVKGGAGDDTAMILAGTYGADAFKGLFSIENIKVMDPTSTSVSSIKLRNDFFKNADVGAGGATSVDVRFEGQFGSQHALDASAVTLATASVHAFFAGGDDTFIGGAGADEINFNSDGGSFYELTAADKVDGGLGRDSIVLDTNGKTSILLDTALAGVSHVEELRLLDSLGGKTGSAISVSLSDNAMAAGIDLVDASDTKQFSLDATLFTDDLTVLAGKGAADSLTFGAGNATVVFGPGLTLGAGDTLVGGSGSNTVQFTGDATVTDAQFAHVNDFQNIALVNGTFSVTLGGGADNADILAGIDTIDASKAGHGSTIDVSAMTNTVDVTGSVGDDSIKASKGGGTIIGGSGADTLTAGVGIDTFSYGSTADSVLVSDGNLSHVDKINGFSHAQGDTIDLTAFDLSAPSTVTESLSAAAADANLFAGKQGATIVNDGADSYVFADTNGNGSFDFNSDLVIKVVGVHVVSADIAV